MAKEYDSSMKNTIGLLRGVYEVNSNNDTENGNNDTESGSFRIRWKRDDNQAVVRIHRAYVAMHTSNDRDFCK